jgi:hypothetical protein
VVGQPAHRHATHAHREEPHQIGKRGHRAPVAEFGGDLLQADDRQVDRAAAQPDAEHRQQGEPPSIAAVDSRTSEDSGHSLASAQLAATMRFPFCFFPCPTAGARNQLVRVHGSG